MLQRCYWFALLTSWAVWFGGLTVYAAVVVPIGTEIIGVVEQGFVTQRVTGWLNWLGIGFLAFSCVPVWRSGNRAFQWCWCGLLVCQLALFALHLPLDRRLLPDTMEVTDRDAFYQWHRAYLLTTTLQWLLGLAILWCGAGAIQRSFVKRSAKDSRATGS